MTAAPDIDAKGGDVGDGEAPAAAASDRPHVTQKRIPTWQRAPQFGQSIVGGGPPCIAPAMGAPAAGRGGAKGAAAGGGSEPADGTVALKSVIPCDPDDANAGAALCACAGGRAVDASTRGNPAGGERPTGGVGGATLGPSL